MKRLNNCVVENCIPTPASCVEWNGGDIKYLGICNGEFLTNVIWEIVNKLQDIAGEDLSKFDIDSLLDICSQKRPLETNIITILSIIRDNQVCLKDYINTLNDKIVELGKEQGIDVNLKCFADFDNLGNALSITRKELDQLVIDQLCNQRARIETLEGKVINLQVQLDDIDSSSTVDELNIATCIDATSKPTSSQVIITAQAHCDLEDGTGSPAAIATALSNTPTWNAEFSLIPNWNLTPSNWAQNYSNLLLAFNNVWERLKFIEENCCAATCEDVKLGFTAIFNEDGDGIIIKFTAGAGTNIPSGFTDQGSTGTITDIDGNVESFNLTIANNYQVEVAISGLNTLGDLEISITAVIGNDALTCEKCLHKVVKTAGCGYCEITAEGDDGSYGVIIYTDDAEDSTTAGGGFATTPLEQETEETTSTTTTTTEAP